MKKVIAAILFSAAMAFTFNASAEEVTLKGTASCAKCEEGTADKCTNILTVGKGDDKVVYTLEGKAGKPWHKNVCKKTKKVEMTGTVSEKDGEKVLTVTEIK